MLCFQKDLGNEDLATRTQEVQGHGCCHRGDVGDTGPLSYTLSVERTRPEPAPSGGGPVPLPQQSTSTCLCVAVCGTAGTL